MLGQPDIGADVAKDDAGLRPIDGETHHCGALATPAVPTEIREHSEIGRERGGD
jgi:hypothetical protein